MKKLVVAALQLPTLGMNATRLEFYLKKATERGTQVMLLGEYVLNHFFKELAIMSKSMIKAQTKRHLQLLKELSIDYDIVLISPIILVKSDGYYKTIVKITPKNTSYYEQQILIPYEHWNEKIFFSNKVKPFKDPMVFRLQGFKIMVMAGFEMHFDLFWQKVMEKKVDLVLLPTASTFDSHNRWREIIKTKAFLHGCFILRANRLGEYVDKGTKWHFYGDTMLVSPKGEVEMMLEDKESMLIEEIDKKEITEHRKIWKFEKILREHKE
ncbi:MAG: carbon-nitrogen hydrolase family protein [Sulfurovum sp.]|nr:carbon-nitrogen hydrolase family protein [Sulfurovum sp.]MCB4744372.1 carbon-nitrogen hydrolase family protein [Sulfurovum sp.]MCB4746484.1 carbon-nitrogen hydrolase family protein [Sulfurovum sp.]MCB4749425.1 carbon-nitrogen hydrolase family protein [Sulfurovum sp.]MCB4750498.1 carbon-nitrogen hydrolase family protein [Sulfurovum sp.]